MRVSNFLVLAFALMTVAFLASPAEAFSSHDVAYASVGGETSIPYGWLVFCGRYKSECSGPALAPVDVNLTASARREIEQVNTIVNHAVEPVADIDHWGVVDRWDYPVDGKGDCEDYALLKRRMLIERGYPRQALLITVVRDENNEGHAILTVKTNAGEFILDNLTDELKPVDQVTYRLVKRQSQQDPNVWVALGPAAAPVYASR
ncbi:transglutaminase-like cysteine peptidase [Rhodoblastus acidophilus]|uniref:Transglutaminase-like cysteine peptidase n=1 Tax=Candidatus Rhodoblastus alkanivorans TaxID=2954117 RepID=A0ABS9Z831_9HYPH|nr:transglutaminase-like cysteine peptidase [Candidatus Rhodoblastus alkanivorans]MCI4678342.1 transglutaminase-like cysteine peptidase [Candidatus Rhodoblastus alkanivorans]MCI4683600.1 transglutaminase-like cysteine peptidase [Candidatus Rhodoblastus alkanivorans]MDI4640916.1 transglutaminase-like cysteine peptidase [Rhodoblastus acidophilus]